jgi:hypothetical protein
LEILSATFAASADTLEAVSHAFHAIVRLCSKHTVIPTEIMDVRKGLGMVVSIRVAELFNGPFAQLSPENFPCLQGPEVSSGVSSGKEQN